MLQNPIETSLFFWYNDSRITLLLAVFAGMPKKLYARESRMLAAIHKREAINGAKQ